MSVVGQAFVEVLPLSTGFAPALDKQLKASMAKATATTDTAFAGISRKVTLGVAAVGVAAVAASVKAAASFDTLTTSLVTGAGESEKNLDKVRSGILKLAPAMGTSATQLANGLYMIESAGFHGSAGLDVLRSAAEGAKVGNADLATVANAVTTALVDYHLPASQAASVTSMLVETVASGKTHMQDLAGALSVVLPVAAAAHIGLEDVNGALATMTGQGISANEAAQNVANVIRNLQNPSEQARAALEQLGLNVTSLQTGLGTRGLQGTLELVTDTIAHHMGPQGLVLVNALKQSQTAAADAQTELKLLPPSLQGLARQFMAGSVTGAQWRKDLKGMGVDQRELLQQFAATVARTRGFNDALKSGSPAAKTLSATLSEVLGGATGLNAALALTGPNMATYKQNLVNIYNAGVDAKTGLPTKEVQGFNLVQKDFGFQVDQAKAGVQAFAITIGEKLIPVIQSGIKVGTESLRWLAQHKDVAYALAGVIGGALVLAIAAYATQMAVAAIKTTADFVGMMAKGAAWVVEQVAQFTVAEGAATAFGVTMESVGAASMLALGGTILIIAAVAGAAYLIVRNWSTIKSFFVGLWHDIQHIFSGAWEAIKGAIRPTVDWLTGVWGDIVGGVMDAVHGIENAFDAVTDWFKKWWPVLLAVALPGLGIIIDEIVLHWHTLLAITKTVFGAISDAVGFAWHYISEAAHIVLAPLIDYISMTWNQVSAVTRLVWDLIKTFFTVWWAVVQAEFTIALTVVKAILQQAWNTITLVVHLVWDAIKTYFEIWWALVSAIVRIGWDVIHGLFTVALDLIEGKWGAAWGAIKDTFSGIWDIIEGTVRTVWGDITGFLGTALSAFGGWWSATWNNIAGTFNNVWKGISGGVSGVWKGISGGISAGIRDVENIINSAFINPINAVLGVFGVNINPFNTSTASAGSGISASAFGTGGAQGGMKRAARGMIVNSPTVLVGEGGRGFPESVIPWDPIYRDRAHSLLAQTIEAIGMPGMKKGGIVSGIVSGVEDATGISAVKSALGWVDRHVAGPAIDSAAGIAEGLVRHIPPAVIGTAAAGLIKTTADAIKAMLGAGGGVDGGLKGSIPSAAHAGLIAQALQLAGVAVNGPDEAAVNLIVTHESGWNPQAINLTDSNAQAGHPSQGLMQTIPGTFEAYRLASLPDVITDPLANLVAGIRYAVGRYGSLMAVPGVAAVSRGGAYVGYDSGGWLMPGVTMAVNSTGVPERVISPTGAGPGGGITLAAGAVNVEVVLSGDTSSAAGIQTLIRQGVQQGVTEALEEVAGMSAGARPVGY